MSSVNDDVFDMGTQTVQLLKLGPETSSHPPPPKPLLIATPTGEGEYPVLVFLHGYLLYNTFYSQLLIHVASHGFIVVAPQKARPRRPQPRRQSRLALTLGFAPTTLKFSALIGIDPVDGTAKGNQTSPPVLTYIPRSFDLNSPVMVIGSGLGEVKRNALFPACAPKGVNHSDFFKECHPPACYFVAKDCGHLDMLDDETKGLRGKVSYCLCKNGKARGPMRRFVGGVVVAFLKARLEGDDRCLVAIRDDPAIAPVVLERIEFLE
ncbi:hypothetical protein QJS10_CPB15g01868 [Acorus calamus]|uniref:Chlorophyllase n=1 Tax=Acorus calamus TaxID=4465 RepID=A0AAV9D4R2_ACOCL|nr:hypothetical protein QJS10_CPB15g01868 [Acorus calamus]